MKTFVREVANRLDFLRTEHGFTGPKVVPGQTGVYPLLRSVRYEHTGLVAEISLVLSYMGEEYMATDVLSEDDSGSVCRMQMGSGTAPTGYQMRRALDRQVGAVREVLRKRMPLCPD